MSFNVLHWFHFNSSALWAWKHFLIREGGWSTSLKYLLVHLLSVLFLHTCELYRQFHDYKGYLVLLFLVLNGYPVSYSQASIVAAAAAANHRAFQPATSPGPLDQLYSPTNELALANYGQQASPQPGAFPSLALGSRVCIIAALIILRDLLICTI